MKIRTQLILGLFALAFTPLLLSVGLNMPRVLSQFKAVDENRQLLLIQKNSSKSSMALKWNRDSLKSLSFNMGAVELASNISSDLSVQTLKKRVGEMVVRWYQDNPEVLAVQLFNRQGEEQFVVRRDNDGFLSLLPESKDSSCPSHLFTLADFHSDGEVYNSGFEITETAETGRHSVIMYLGVALQNHGEIVGAASLSVDLSFLLQHDSGYLASYNRKTNQYTPLYESGKLPPALELPEGLVYPDEPVLIRGRAEQDLAIIPIFTDGHLFENVLFVYPVKIGSTMVWVEKWRKQMAILVGLVLLVVCFIAVKFSALLDRFVKELLTAFQDLLHKQKPVNFSWSKPQEIQKLSQDLNNLSQHYIESLRSQEEMRQKTQEMEKELRQSQKMKALALLAGGVAHDLNNILSGVVSYPQLLLLQLPQESDLRSSILEIQRSGERAAAVVADLLTVARGVASEKERADLNSLVQEYFDSPECSVQKRNYPEVACVRRLSSEELPIFCSSVHVKKTLMNLLINAAESIQGVGEVVVSTRREQQAEKDLRGSSLVPGDYALLQVQDTGPGIDNKDLEHIFEPFYSKKKMGQSGTGLGLTVVWNTMNDHDGRVKVTSSKKGTCFELLFPLYQGGETVHPDKPEKKDLQGNGEHILVIDDEALQRDLAAQILGIYGYQVETVASGEEAVAFMATHGSDLLLVDMIMDPGIDGLETYRKILETWPHQRAIIVSGFSESQAVEKTKQLGATDLLKKPYSPQNLALAVKKALQEREE